MQMYFKSSLFNKAKFRDEDRSEIQAYYVERHVILNTIHKQKASFPTNLTFRKWL